MTCPFDCHKFGLNDALSWLTRIVIMVLLVIILIEIGHLREQISREPVQNIRFVIDKYATIKVYAAGKWDVDVPKELPEPTIKEVFKNNKKEKSK